MISEPRFPSAPLVDVLELRQAVVDLFPITPWRGLGKGLALFFGAAFLWSASLYQPFSVSFFIWSLVTAIWTAAALITTHDALHHTLTGISWFDELLPRLISYPVLWPHGVYAELHLLHHQMNGANTADPERVTPTQEEYESAGVLGRWYYRNQLLVEVFLCGGFGMHAMLAKSVIRHFRTSPALRRQIFADLVGIAGINTVLYTVAIHSGFGWKYLCFYLIQERVAGFVMMLRTHVEHYGLWGQGAHFFETQVLRSRNTITSELVSHYFNRLNFHSAHHTFVEIPFYNLAEANRRILALFDARGAPPPREIHYFSTLLRFAGEPHYIVNADSPHQAAVVPIPTGKTQGLRLHQNANAVQQTR